MGLFRAADVGDLLEAVDARIRPVCADSNVALGLGRPGIEAIRAGRVVSDAHWWRAWHSSTSP